MAETGTALTRADSSAWRIACNREPVIRSLVALPEITRDAAAEASDALGLGRSQIFALVARYRARPVTSTLLDRPNGFPRGRSRLDPDVERAIDAEIEGFFLRRPKPTLAQLVREIWHACHEQGLKRPTRRSIATRVATIERDRLIKMRDGAKAAADLYRPVTRFYTAERPLEIVQMDHTLADIIIVDEHFRRPLCRPTLTLQIDVATRTIPGFYISLESPSATSVGMAIRHAVLPKADWLEKRGINLDYPVCGIPEALHLDNAREFHSRALTRGCQQHGIALLYRPIRTPHFGGHIERLIGTTVGAIHLLPGTTFASIAAKGDYDAEGQACMTLTEFERWFALQVGIYHGTVHRALGVTPITAWTEGWADRLAPPRLPSDPGTFLFDFLPFEMRKVRREGIELFHSFYWHGALAGLVTGRAGKLPVKYHPLNLSSIYLELPDGGHLAVPLRDRRRPAITKFEHDLAMKTLRERGRRAVDEQSLFGMIDAQRRLVLEAVDKTKAARRSAQRAAYALNGGSPADLPGPPPSPSASPRIEDTEPIIPLQIEERS